MKFWEFSILSVKEQIVANGFAFLPSLHSAASSIDVAATIGRSIALNGINPLYRLTPKTACESTPNSYSGIYGLGMFPLHTDLAQHPLPPRYFILRCITGHHSVRTSLVDGYEIATVVGLSLLARSLVQPRRPTSRKLPLMTLYSVKNDVGLLRWDEQFIKPASRAGEQGSSAFVEALKKVSPTEFCLEGCGDTLVIDNWRMLHGRSAVPFDSRTRVIERIYLEEML